MRYISHLVGVFHSQTKYIDSQLNVLNLKQFQDLIDFRPRYCVIEELQSNTGRWGNLVLDYFEQENPSQGLVDEIHGYWQEENLDVE